MAYRIFVWLYVLIGLSIIGLGWYWGHFGLTWVLALMAWSVYYLVSGLIRVECVQRRRRRSSAGLCRRCGYDLRASTGRCPECGEVIQP
jgi:hypothetical protein